MKGSAAFVPGYAPSSTLGCGTAADSELKCILHLGAQNGALAIPDSHAQLLQAIAQRVAEWIAQTEQFKIDQTLRLIRDDDHLNIGNIPRLAARAREFTKAVGCSIFLNALNIRLLGVPGPTLDDLETILVELLRLPTTLPESTEQPWCQVIEMFASFLGLSNYRCSELLAKPTVDELARLSAGMLYVWVVSSDAQHLDSESQLTELVDIVAEFRTGKARNIVIRRFANYFVSNVYLPGVGLTGWVLGHNHSLRIAGKTDEAIDSEPSAYAARPVASWRRVALDALVRLGCDPRESALFSDMGRKPIHVNHIEEHGGSGPDDTFLASPIEGIGDGQLPTGVIRVCGSAFMKRRFSQADEDVIATLSRHIRDSLRSEQMLQAAYLENELERRGEIADFRHVMARLDEQVGYVRANLKRQSGGLTGDEKEHIDRLQEICDTALARDEHEAIALTIRQLDLGRLPSPMVEEYLRRWLNAARLPAEVRCVATNEHELAVAKKVVVATFRAVEEIVKNLRRHRGMDRVSVCLCAYDGGEIRIYRSGQADLLSTCETWHEYAGLAKGQRRGGGMRVLQYACQSGLRIEYSLPNTSEHEMDMFVRIGLSDACGAVV